MIYRTIIASLAMGLVIIAVAGCRDDAAKHGNGAGAHSGGAPGTPQAETAGDPMKMMAHNDKDLATMLIEHHAGAIRLADLELQKGQDADAKAMAQKNKDAQTKEVQDLQRLQTLFGGPGMSMSADMKAKQAKAEQELSAATGHDVDHAFLKHMTDHHKDGIMMAQASMPNLKNDELKRMVEKMVKDQQQDIKKMQKMMAH